MQFFMPPALPWHLRPFQEAIDVLWYDAMTRGAIGGALGAAVLVGVVALLMAILRRNDDGQVLLARELGKEQGRQ